MLLLSVVILILMSMFILIEIIIFRDIFDTVTFLTKDQLLNIKLDILEKIIDNPETLSNRWHIELKYVNDILENLDIYSVTYVVYFNVVNRNHKTLKNHFLIENNAVVDVLLSKIINQNLGIYFVNKLSKKFIEGIIRKLLIKVLINQVIFQGDNDFVKIREELQ